MQKLSRVLITIMVSLLSTVSAMAQDEQAATVRSTDNGLTQFEAFTQDLATFSADFSQQVYDAQGRLEETSTGVLHLSQPNLLYWQYLEPFPQLIVADGNKVWSHDIELEQITVRDQSGAQTQSPLTLLTDTDKLYRSFTLRDLGTEGELVWLEMVPRDDPANDSGISSSDFARIVVAMRDGQLFRMALEDTLGQSTQIEFNEPKRNAELDGNIFVFSPPEGVDVLDG